jgi:hypothetical protein
VHLNQQKASSSLIEKKANSLKQFKVIKILIFSSYYGNRSSNKNNFYLEYSGKISVMQ